MIIKYIMNPVTYRNKVIVVPYARLQGNNHARVILFKDTSSGDWTFVSGGCKQKEEHFTCASRELIEESKKTLNLANMQNMFTFSFQSTYRPSDHAADDKKRKIKVITRYVVYVVKMPFTTLDELAQFQRNYKASYVGNKKEFNETNDVAFVTPQELLTNKYKLWDFMKKEVVPLVVPLFQNGKLA